MAIIEVEGASKEFRVHKRQPGVVNALKALFRREYEIVQAVQDVSFQIEPGELVGYIGPNGAGKSTTIKMLSGILVPTSGTVRVSGRTPHAERRAHAKHIGVVFGQRSQLYWDLPMAETLGLYKAMYEIDDATFTRNVDLFTDMLEMKPFFYTPVRQLSLGQKMRANLALALLHDPDIVFLDEPTIGLDVVAKNRIRRFVREINRQRKVTVILTTHDMDDVEAICDRLIMIDHGRLLFDGHLADFKRRFGKGRALTVECAHEGLAISDSRLQISGENDGRTTIAFQPEEITSAEAVAHVMEHNQVIDLALSEQDIEEIVREVYEGHTGIRV